MEIARTPLLCLGVVVLLAGNATGHDLLLDPSHDDLDAGAVVSMRLFLGHADEAQTVKPSTKASEVYVCVTPDGKRHVPGGAEQGLGLFDATQAGVYLFGYATRPALLNVPPDDLLDVWREAGKDKKLGAVLEKSHVVRPWRVEERHHAKSVVVLDKGTDGKHDHALGLALELFLDRRPDRIQVGKPTRVKLTDAGGPVAGARVVAFPRIAPTRERVVRTNAKGEATITFPTSGAWGVRHVRLRRASRESAADWIVSRATLTFEIPAPKPKPTAAAKKAD